MIRTFDEALYQIRTWCISLVLALVLLYPAQATAHGGLKSSHPGKNEVVAGRLTEIRLDFSEKPELAVTSLRLANSRGDIIDLGRTALKGNSITAPLDHDLAPGRYHVEWKTAGRDGHPVSGDFYFEIANPDLTPPLVVGEG
ncbi:MAG TPA: copper resistance protein CopC, partial [Gemmatimonadaceae bacterium]|nr:copper resistance protein CopC [Gemmatimonadaceae bacterium]